MTITKINLDIDCDLKEHIKILSQKSGLSVNDYIGKLIQKYDINQTKNIQSELFETQTRLKPTSDTNGNYKKRAIHLDDIFDSLYDGLYIADGRGFTININKAFTRITGIPKKDLIGQHLQTLIDEGFFTKAVTLMVLEQKKQVTTMSTIINNNKKVLLTGNPIFDENGEITLVITNVRDITELINLKQKLENTEKMTRKYHEELELLRNQQFEKTGLIGESLGMEQIKTLIYQVAKVDATVLLMGETGVGKEVVAREIYKNSTRKNGPFIKVNCAAIPENLLESELFGYEKGAFTGAQNKDKLGMFELADSGTILLDEIGELSKKLQSKLLRVLQEKEVTRIGGSKPIKLDVRVIAATNQKLKEQVKKGLFREDLYYRLNVIPIQIPPLRSRKEDIPLLTHYFLDIFNKKYNKNKQIDISALDIFNQHQWPGNIRELQNHIERLVVIVNDKVITSKHLTNMLDKKNITTPYYLDEKNITLKEAVNLVERHMIDQALNKHRSTRRAASALGVSQPTVIRKARMLGIKTSE